MVERRLQAAKLLLAKLTLEAGRHGYLAVHLVHLGHDEPGVNGLHDPRLHMRRLDLERLRDRLIRELLSERRRLGL